MNQDDPREKNSLLRAVEKTPAKPLFPVRKASRPPQAALCSGCGSAELSCVPTFSIGSGVAGHPFPEDVICLKCGLIAPPAF